MYGNLVSDSIWNSIDPIFRLCSVRFSSVTQSCPTFCDPMDCSMPGFSVLHHLPELAQTHVPWISDAIQPSHPRSSPSPPAFSLSHSIVFFYFIALFITKTFLSLLSILGTLHSQGSFPMSQFFTSGGQSIGASASTSVLPMNIQDWFPLGWTGLISLLSKGLSRAFSHTTVQKHQFFALNFFYGPTLTSIHDYWKNHSFDYTDLCW